jgi:cytochrome c oxidase assembly protein subunit 11
MRAPDHNLLRRHRSVALACAVFVAAMVGAAYASVPLYDWFCRTTGFAGRPVVATVAPGAPIGRKITVRFDANVAPGLPWTFAPEQREVELHIGESVLVHYVATSYGDKESVGSATYNVSPPEIGGFFNKLQCFCFTEQRLMAGERLTMPIPPSRACNRSRSPTLSSPCRNRQSPSPPRARGRGCANKLRRRVRRVR